MMSCASEPSPPAPGRSRLYPPRHPLPEFGCDTHVHVLGPFRRFPLSSPRAYSPGPASVTDLRALLGRLGLRRVVVVQSSPQGQDNACLLDALNTLNASGIEARGVVVIDADAPDALMGSLHAQGVRGVRVNLESAGEHDPAVAAARIEQVAGRIAPWGWHVQTFTSLAVIGAIADTLKRLPVPIVIDHFGRAMAAKGVGQPGFDRLLDLVAQGKAWVKLSAAQRISDAPDCADAYAIARALIDANPERTLWGSDWPHPGAWPGRPRHPDRFEPYHPINDARALQRLSEWTDRTEWRATLESNPARLYGF